MTAPHRIFVGFDPYEIRPAVVTETSFRIHAPGALILNRVSRLSLLKIYLRQTTVLGHGKLWDVISDAPMSTDHAIARFFVPYLCDYHGWALFTDGDILCRRDVRQLFALADPRYAVQVVQHPELRDEGMKKGDHYQVSYRRKNWSSVILWNCGHPAHQALTLDVLNHWTGRMLHAFEWLTDGEIGALPEEWNYLVGVNPPQDNPAIVHYTTGCPDVPGHASDPFAEEWFAIARMAGYAFEVPT